MAIVNGHGRQLRPSLRRRRVCVLGAGAAGICALRHLSGEAFGEHFEAVCYEQTDKLGGTWNYVENVGKDQFGLPIHSSMYRDLKTNIPIEVMEYPDFKSNFEHSYVTHQEVLQYLNEYAQYYNIIDRIRFRHHVVEVKLDQQHSSAASTTEPRWLVTVDNLLTGQRSVEVFDLVFICNGRYSTPYTPDVQGMDQFRGHVMHSHDYRSPERFAHQKVIVVGGSSSGIDICLELIPHADQVIMLNRTEFQYQDLPANVIQLRANVDCFDGDKTIELVDCVDAAKKYRFEVDTVIFATGYELRLDFLDCKRHGLKLDPVNAVLDGLWRHYMNIEHPSMVLIGIVHRVIPFPFYHQQILFYLKMITNQIRMPSAEEMEAEVAEELRYRDEQGYRYKDRHFFRVRDMQKYLQKLEQEGDLEPIKETIYDFYEEYMVTRSMSVTTFRNVDYTFYDKHYTSTIRTDC